MNTLIRIILALLGSGAALLTAGTLYFKRKTNDEVRRLFAAADQEGEQIVTAEMLQELPHPVRRYLTYTGVVGRPMVKTVRLKQEGRIRQDEQQPWMEIAAEEYYTVSPPTFVWRAGARMGGIPLPLARVRDRYAGGKGNMLITLGGLLPMDDARGPEMDQGSMMRYLNEIMWFPAAFLGDNITWEEVDDHSARVTLTDSGQSVTGLMTFDEDGRLTNFVADRYRDSGEGSELVTWSTPIAEYGQFEGLRLPVRGSGVWHLDSGDLTYIELKITDIQYNRPDLY